MTGILEQLLQIICLGPELCVRSLWFCSRISKHVRGTVSSSAEYDASGLSHLSSFLLNQHPEPFNPVTHPVLSSKSTLQGQVFSYVYFCNCQKLSKDFSFGDRSRQEKQWASQCTGLQVNCIKKKSHKTLFHEDRLLQTHLLYLFLVYILLG